jgi:hypothetical protein
MATFTAVAAGVGLATTAVTTAVSFAQAAEQNQKKIEAEEAAAKAMSDARKKLDVNYYEQLSIQKEPYELMRRELLSQGALATQQLAEGDQRALAGGVGRVQLAQQLGQEKVATAMQQEQTQLEKLVAGEESRLRDLKTQLDLQEAIGAQEAAADAQRAEAMAVQQGMAGVTSLAGSLSSFAPLYEKSPDVIARNKMQRQAEANPNIDLSSIDLSNRESIINSGLNLSNRQIDAVLRSGKTNFSDFNQYILEGGSSDTDAPNLGMYGFLPYYKGSFK